MCVSRLKGGGGLGKKTSDRVNVQVLTSVPPIFSIFQARLISIQNIAS